MKKATIFGKYLLLDRLNVGGMAEVFLAKAFGAEGLERYVAIKKILPSMAEDEEFIRMFIDEARISVQLNHANVVHIHDLDRAGDSHYIAMEYVAGKDVRTLLERFRKRGAPMPVPQAVFIASRMCEGLHYAHTKKDARGQELGIIHRDVSPQNILVSYEGEVKIIDFGIAKAANRSQKTQAGILKGKFGYMSPEMVRGQPIDRRSDIFAMGIILYELLTGEKLFTGESDYSVLEKVRNAQVPVPRTLNPEIPAGLERVLMKALAREPTDRYQWAADLQEDLIRFLLVGEQIFTSKHLSEFMKTEFADEISREAVAMKGYATVERPAELGLPSGEAAPRVPPAHLTDPEAFGVDGNEEEGVDKTQLLDQEAIDALDLDAPSQADDLNEATRFDAVNPFGHEVAAAGERAKVVVGGDGEAYSGATVVGVAPSRTQAELPAAGTAEPTRLFSSHSAQDEAGDEAPEEEDERDQTDPRRSLEMLAASGDRDEAGSTARPDVRNGKNRSARPSGSKARGRPLRAQQEAFGSEGDEDATAAGRRPDSAGAGFDADDQGSADQGSGEDSDGLEEVTGSAPHPGESAVSRLKQRLDALHPKWLPMVAGCAAALILVTTVALVAHRSGPKLQDLMVRVLTPVNATITVDGAPVKNGVVTQVLPGLHEVNVSAQGFVSAHQRLAVVPGRQPPVVELTLAPTAPPQMADSAKSATAPEANANANPAPPQGTEPPDAAGKDASASASSNQAAAPTPPATQPDHPAQAAAEEPSRTPPAPKTFAARFDSDEGGVTVEVDGKRVGQTPDVTLAKLLVGKTYRYTAKRSGYRTKSGSFESKDGSDVTVSIALEKVPQPVVSHHAKTVEVPRIHSSSHSTAHASARSKVVGRLAASTHPAGAEIFVDNRATGRHTPVAPGSPLVLPVGTHQVVFKLGSKRSSPQRIVIDENETTKLINVPLE